MPEPITTTEQFITELRRVWHGKVDLPIDTAWQETRDAMRSQLRMPRLGSLVHSPPSSHVGPGPMVVIEVMGVLEPGQWVVVAVDPNEDPGLGLPFIVHWVDDQWELNPHD